MVRCGDVEIDAGQECVRRAGVENRLRQKSFQVLLCLIENRQRVVSKAELFDTVWNGTAVTEDTLVQSVVEIRKALGDDPRSPRFIRTSPKSGYRFIAPIDDERPIDGTLELETVQHVEVEIAEETDERRSLLTRNRVAVMAVSLVVVCVVAVALLHGRTGNTAAAEATGRTTVAVMFFDKRNGGADVDWLREGLPDMLITQLSRSDSLSVVSRDRLALLMQRSGFDGASTVPIGKQLEMARQAGAARLITGTFAQLAGAIRVDAQLRDVERGTLLAGESVVAQPEQFLARMDRFSSALASRLQVSDGHPTRLVEAMTDNLEAYRLYSLGLELAEGLRTKEAISRFEHAAALDPDFAMAHARIGYSYGIVWNFPERARPYLGRALQLRHRLTEKDRLYVESWHAIVDNQFGTAIHFLRTLINRYPTEIEAYERLGKLLFGEEQREEAATVLERGLLVDPASPALHNALSGVYLQMKRAPEAVDEARKYVALAPREPNAHDTLAMTLQACGEYKEAVAEYKASLAIDPQFVIARIHLANTYFQTGRYRDALREFDRYVQDAPADFERARGYDSQAWVYRSLGDLRRADELARKAYGFHRVGSGTLTFLYSDRRDLASLRQLRAETEERGYGRGMRPSARGRVFHHGYEALRNGQPDAAIGLFQQSLRYMSPYWSIDPYDDGLANAYLALGRFDDAVREYQRVLAFNANHALSHFHLAAAYDGLGRHAEARREYESFLRVWNAADTDIPEVVEARKRLRGRRVVVDDTEEAERIARSSEHISSAQGRR